MSMAQEATGKTVNVLIVGIGGQGALKTGEVLSEVLVRLGHDVKQSEVHGMSQRGGSVTSEVRYGREVHSPVIGAQEADFVIALDANEGRRSEPRLRPGNGRLVTVPDELVAQLPDPRGKNMAALGLLSRHLDIDPTLWHDAIRHYMPPESIEANIKAFELAREFKG